ncbi:MAG: hypothetical protein COA78_18085 [Blastopirellula sp.]|nr:MAG: hypothetical protein COA78_18085 [Blastopirellula sp.]
MKRLDLLSAPAEIASEESDPNILQFKIERFKTSKTAVEFFAPLHYEQGYAYPLLIWLHGPQDTERQIRRIMPLTSTRNFVAVAPRAPRKVAQLGSRTATYNWVQEPSDIERSCSSVLRVVDLASEKYNIHANRIFIGGYSDGGTMALRIALRYPHLFAGVASIGGAFPKAHAPLRNIGSSRKLPMLLMHSQESTNYPESELCTDLKLLHTAGMSIDLRQYLCAQEMTTEMLSDLNNWVMQNIASASC